MRGIVRDMRNMHVARATSQKSGTDMVESFGSPISFYGTLTQENGQQSADIYGVRLPYIKRVTSATADLMQGDGVWIDAATTGEPDYRVISVIPCARTTEYLVEKRGVFGA